MVHSGFPFLTLQLKIKKFSMISRNYRNSLVIISMATVNEDNKIKLSYKFIKFVYTRLLNIVKKNIIQIKFAFSDTRNQK